ncbi:MAG: DUF721 domain-containing protein [Armatimonadetes bacterium]|nr:DUF721 domain-containing protein [Armatimonadota bacterium]
MVTPVRTILKAVTQTWGLERAARLAAAAEHWAGVVGPVLAERSAPVGLRGDTLLVGVIHSTVGQEIRLRRTAITRKLAAILGQGAVRDVTVVPRRRLRQGRALSRRGGGAGTARQAREGSRAGRGRAEQAERA